MLNLFAGNKTELHVTTGFNVEGQLVPTGDYTLEWDSHNGPETQVKIIKGSKVVATVRGKWVTLDKKSPANALVISNGDGVVRLVQIRFAGKDQALEVSPETAANKSDAAGHAKADAPRWFWLGGHSRSGIPESKDDHFLY
jgi:hypothetical protein